MIPDRQHMFSIAQDIGQVQAAYLSTNTIDMGALGTNVFGDSVQYDPGSGGAFQVYCKILEAVVGTSSTILFELVSADNAALSSNLTVLYATAAIPEATLVVGYNVQILVPTGITQRYLGMRYTVGTATTTAGTVSSGIIWDRQTAPTAARG